jgi:hypothetical protein
MNFRVTLAENLSNDTPSALWMEYKYRDGHIDTWRNFTYTPETGVKVVSVNSGNVDLANMQDVLTRTLIGHYPAGINTLRYQILSVIRE